MKPGDIVTLKSGGPKMTVEEIREIPGDQPRPIYVDCTWFSGDSPLSKTFKKDALTEDVPPSSLG